MHEVLVYLTIAGEEVTTTPEHPFLRASGEWTPAGELALGAALRRADGSVGRVQAIAFAATPQVMYNMTVANAHTYTVGDGKWLVHNSCNPVRWSSLDPDVADLANAIETRYPGHVQGVNVMRSGYEIDIETANAIIEVKGGNGRGLGRQITDRSSILVNPTSKPVIGYARHLGPHAMKEINQRGGIAAGGVASTLEILLDILAP